MATHDAFGAWLLETKKKYPQHVQGPKLERFVTTVRSDPSFQSILGTFNQPGMIPSIGFEFLCAAASNGCCVMLREFLDQHNVNLVDEDGITALHMAVEYGNYEDVKVLLEAGARVTTDSHLGLTPLHIAALSVKPNPRIAKLLIRDIMLQNTEMTGYKLINAQSCETCSRCTKGNTALHFAAGNRQTTAEFIHVLKTVDPSVKNENGETAFHVAAREGYPEIIVCMLEVFTPAEKGWRMADIDSDGKPTLLEVCARIGNAEAVALLINYGANITEKILFDLIDESVRSPENTKSLLGVYRTITENCVLWSWLKATPEERRHYPRNGTEPTAYRQKQRVIMLNLLNNTNGQGWNVVQHAIVSGAEAFLNEIINAPPKVFEITEDREEVTCQHSSMLYDVTNFVVPPIGQYSVCKGVCKKNCIAPEDTDRKTTSVSMTSYLDLIVDNEHLWENTDILQAEPFRKITEPIVRRVWLGNVAFLIIQMHFMFFFSFFYMPSYCSLVDTFNLHISDFNVSLECNPSVLNLLEINVSHSYRLPNPLWLIWPVALLIATLFFTCRCHDKSPQQFLYGMCTPRLPFGFSVCIWYFAAYANHELYLILTSLVLLFGWLLLLSFATGIYYFEKISIILFLLTDIIFKDIFSFFVVFFYILFSFTAAIHVLRESALVGNSTLFSTMYQLFASTLTTGDFIDETSGGSQNFVGRYVFMRIMFALYLCCTTIIMLNLLISMMNNSYKMAKLSANNVRRFQAIRSGLRFIRFLSKLFRRVNSFKYFTDVRSESDNVSVHVLNQQK